VLRGQFAHTVVAVDGASEAAVLRAALDAADRALLLSEQSVLHSRYNQALLRGLRDAGCRLEHAGLVVDRYHRKHPVEPARLAALLQLPLLATLGGDAAVREQAMNAGEPLFSLAPRDEYAEAVGALARQLAARVPEAMPRRGVLGRLLQG
jgi:pilus assembly protein CpaE